MGNVCGIGGGRRSHQQLSATRLQNTPTVGPADITNYHAGTNNKLNCPTLFELLSRVRAYPKLLSTSLSTSSG